MDDFETVPRLQDLNAAKLELKARHLTDSVHLTHL